MQLQLKVGVQQLCFNTSKCEKYFSLQDQKLTTAPKTSVMLFDIFIACILLHLTYRLDFKGDVKIK